MKKIIKGRIYDTSTAKQLNFKYAGEYGDADGYEEKLYLTKSGQYFIFGTGGLDSPYPKPTIKPITKEEANEWGIEIPENKEIIKEKVSKTKKPAENKNVKNKKVKKPPVKTPAKDAEPVEVAEPVNDAE